MRVYRVLHRSRRALLRVRARRVHMTAIVIYQLPAQTARSHFLLTSARLCDLKVTIRLAKHYRLSSKVQPLAEAQAESRASSGQCRACH